MRLRVIRCEEEGWVDADSCEHWDRKCSRAKKQKKAHHKLKLSEPGFDVLLVRIEDHVYRPNLSAGPDRKLLDQEFGDWHQVPNNMRYADCLCEMPWIMHQPWYGGESRYIGRWHHGRFVPGPRGNLVTCVSCGLVGIT